MLTYRPQKCIVCHEKLWFGFTFWDIRNGKSTTKSLWDCWRGKHWWALDPNRLLDRKMSKHRHCSNATLPMPLFLCHAWLNVFCCPRCYSDVCDISRLMCFCVTSTAYIPVTELAAFVAPKFKVPVLVCGNFLQYLAIVHVAQIVLKIIGQASSVYWINHIALCNLRRCGG